MTEQEYIDVGNLVKIRAAKVLIRDCTGMRDGEEDLQKDILRHLRRWEAKLEQIVNPDPDEDGET